MLAERVGEMLAQCFCDAGKVVCGEWFNLRCDTPDIVSYPDRYRDAEGAPMWNWSWNSLIRYPLIKSGNEPYGHKLCRKRSS